MSILVHAGTRAIVQGITGREGSFHTRQMLDYGTRIVAGVTPQRGGQEVHGLPVYDTVAEAAARHEAHAAVVLVPARFAADAIYEAAAADLELIVCLSEHIPVLDMVRARRYVAERGLRLVGPNCPGVITPGECKLGFMPGHIHRPGPIGVVSRSGTLTYEVVNALSEAGLGQSTCVGIGGDPIIGLSFSEVLALFEADRKTEAVVLIGEIGGTDEQEAARFVASSMEKPVVAFIAGQTAPPGRRMGHAGAIISGSEGTAQEKMAALRESGVVLARHPGEIPALVRDALD